LKLLTGNCLPTAFAIATDTPDFESLLIPHGNWHPQECMLLAYTLGYGCLPLYRDCELGDPFNRKIVTDFNKFTSEKLILIDETHAVAYNQGVVYDPKGLRYPLQDIMIYQIIIIIIRGE